VNLVLVCMKLNPQLIPPFYLLFQPFFSLIPGFEIHTGGRSIIPEFLIDDVEVKLIGEGDVSYP